MGIWIGLTFWLLMIAACAAVVARDILNIQRSRYWAHAEALVCADPAHLAMAPSRQPSDALTVLFEAPSGPCIATLRYGGSEDGLSVGSTVPIVYNPEDPSRAELRYSLEAHALTLIWFGGTVALLLFGLWRILAAA